MTSVFYLDGQEIPFKEGQTVLGAAMSAGRYIPHLCWRPELEPHSSCRLCTVIISGKPFASCTQPAMKGQRVECDTPDLIAMRRAVTQLLFVEGNHYCPSCEESGSCKLQAVAYHLGMQDNHFPHQFPIRERDSSHPLVNLDRDRCINCEICVRASRKLDGKNVFAMHGRGIRSRLAVNSPSGKLKDSDIAPDDLAVKLCPTGSLTVKRVGFEMPIGKRVFDQESIAAVELREFACQEATHG
jgi:[NiFe] hydrogenase diaphorase moiety small subunit